MTDTETLYARFFQPAAGLVWLTLHRQQLRELESRTHAPLVELGKPRYSNEY